MFYAGQKVVCVTITDEDVPSEFSGVWHDDQPKVGCVYTIVKELPCPRSGQGVVHLAEIRRSKLAEQYWGYPVGYGAFRFRPVTDISDLQAIVAEVMNRAPCKEPV